MANTCGREARREQAGKLETPFIQPARIQVLLVPIHPIRKETFDRYAAKLASFARIQLSDVPPDSRGERAVFSSSPTTHGELLFSYITPSQHAASAPLSFLSDFQIHRRIHGIIGLLDCSQSETTPLSTALASFQSALKDLPRTSFATKVYAFDPSEDQLREGRGFKESEELVMIPTTGDSEFFLGTVLADFASQILWDFSNSAAQLESRISIPTPQEHLTSSYDPPSTPNFRQSFVSPSTNFSQAPRSPSPLSHSLHTSFGVPHPPILRAASGSLSPGLGAPSGSLFGLSIRTDPQGLNPIHLANGSGGGTGDGLVDSKARKRVVGREKKLMADLWLLSGRLDEAITCYNEAILQTKAWQDSVWQASALEGLCIALVLQAAQPKSATRPPPSASPSPSPVPSSPSIVPSSPDPSTFLSSIPDRLSQAINLYSRMLPSPSLVETDPPPDPDRAHPLVYTEACLRTVRFLLAVWESNGNMETALTALSRYNDPALPRPAVSSKSSPTSSQTLARQATLLSHSPSNTVPRSLIAHYLSLAYGPHLEALQLPIRLQVSGEMATLFGKIGYRRKEGFVLRELAGLAAAGVCGGGIEVIGREKEKPKMPVPSASEVQVSAKPRDEKKESNGFKWEKGYDEDDPDEMGDIGATFTRKPRARAPAPLSLKPNLPAHLQYHNQDRHPNSPLPPSPPPASSLTTERTSGQHTIILLAEKLCSTFGVVVVPRVTKLPILSAALTSADEPTTKEEKRSSVIQGRPLEIAENDSEGRFGWPQLQLGILVDAIAVAEMLQDYQAAIRFTITALRTLSGSMPSSEQYRLSQNIPKIFAAATRQGSLFDLEYWGPTQLLINLAVTPLSHDRQLRERPFLGVSPTSTSAIPEPTFKMIYNPLKGPSAGKARPVLVENESVEVAVTLQNPFLFGLEIQSIELSTSGAAFSADAISIVIPPGSLHTVLLTGTPQAPGTLVLRGCHIRLVGCTSREFVLPVWSIVEEAKRQKVASLDTSKQRVKQIGLDAFDRRSSGAVSEKGLDFLECGVVPELPRLRMKENSLDHGALLLSAGERSTIRITLENVSTTPVDFVKLSFSDSHTASAQAYLDDNDLSPSEAHEVQAEISTRPVFSWNDTFALMIEPGASYTLEVQCRGKLGCVRGSIRVDYAFVGREVVKSSGVFHTRQLLCEIFTTVHRAVSAQLLEILRSKPLPQDSAPIKHHIRAGSVSSLSTRGVALEKLLESGTAEDGDAVSTHCLAVVDVSNSHGQAFDVSLEHADDRQSARQRLEAGANTRLVVRLQRLIVSPEQLATPIPSLSDRQFVVAKVKASVEEERQARELFWYREELLTRLHAHWSEIGGSRTGEISLRGLQVTPSMLDILRGDDVELQMSLAENCSSGPSVFHRFQSRLLQYTAVVDEFMDIAVVVKNNSGDVLQGFLKVNLWCAAGTPASHFAHLSRYVVVDGVGAVPLRGLAPGETQTLRVPICLLAEGVYDFHCVLEEVQPGKITRTEDWSPRRWQARETLTIEVL